MSTIRLGIRPLRTQEFGPSKCQNPTESKPWHFKTPSLWMDGSKRQAPRDDSQQFLGDVTYSYVGGVLLLIAINSNNNNDNSF